MPKFTHMNDSFEVKGSTHMSKVRKISKIFKHF